MNKKSRLLTIVILILVCIILGVSYAYWQITRTQNDKNIVTTGCFEITSDIGTVDEQLPIRLLKTYPISDDDGKELTPFTFTLRNTCDTYAGYQINLETLNTTTLNLDYLKVVMDNKTPKVLSQYDSVETTIVDALNSHKLLTGGLKAGASKTFNLRLWLDQDTPLESGQNKTYEGKISIIASPTNPTPEINCSGQLYTYEITGYKVVDDCVERLMSLGTSQEKATTQCQQISTLLESDSDTPLAEIYITGLIEPIYSKEETELVQGAGYSDGTYLYKYKQEFGINMDTGDINWQNIEEDGWGVKLLDTSLTEISKPPCTSINGHPVVSMSGMFMGSSKIENMDVSSFNTSNVTNMLGMFAYVGSFTNNFEIVGLDNFDTSKVTNMAGMFGMAGYNATTFDIGDISNWDTSNVTRMDSMFSQAGYNAQSWNVGDLSNWNTTNVTNMSRMFSGAGQNSTTWSINLSNWDTSKVTDMSYMFYTAGHMATIWNVGDLSNWNTSNVTNMSYMFNLAGINATTWNSIGTLKVYATNIANMFYISPNAKATLNIYSNPTSYNDAFNSAATSPGSGITVNYSSVTTNIDNIIATKSSNSNVVKGVQLD